MVMMTALVNSKLKRKKIEGNLYVTVTFGKSPADRYIQGDHFMQVFL